LQQTSGYSVPVYTQLQLWTLSNLLGGDSEFCLSIYFFKNSQLKINCALKDSAGGDLLKLIKEFLYIVIFMIVFFYHYKYIKYKKSEK